MILGLLVVTWLYFLAPRTPSKAQSEASESGHSSGAVSIATMSADIEKTLASTEREKLSVWNKAWTNNHDETSLDSIIDFWKTQNDSPLNLAMWLEERAKLHNTVEDWLATAEAYYLAVDQHGAIQNEIVTKHLIPAFRRMSEIEPENLDTKVALGRLLVDHTEQPMEGIGKLMEVIAIDSNHVEANKQLGRFSIISAQYEKAIVRLEKVVSLQPENAEAYYLLAEAYKEMNETLKAVNALEKCKELVDNEEFRKEIDQYIQTIITK